MKNMKVGLNVSIFKEGKMFVAFSPALDLSTSGKSIAEAQKNFSEAVEIFFEETERKGTTNEALISLGWEQKDSKVFPPVEVARTVTNISVPVG